MTRPDVANDYELVFVSPIFFSRPIQMKSCKTLAPMKGMVKDFMKDYNRECTNFVLMSNLGSI